MSTDRVWIDEMNDPAEVKLTAAYSAGLKAGYNQCRAEAATRIDGYHRECDNLKRTTAASVTVIRDLLKDVGANLSELPSVKQAHDYLEQLEMKR